MKYATMFFGHVKYLICEMQADSTNWCMYMYEYMMRNFLYT